MVSRALFIQMVNIALGNTPCCAVCPAADPDYTGSVVVTQIIVAVNNALAGCPTPTPTPTPGSASPGSIVVFAPVEVTATNDPLLSLKSHSNALLNATCFYAAGPAPACVLFPFKIDFTQQETVQWQASAGSGSIPPAPVPFSGELVCVQTDVTGAPLGGNGLSGRIENTGQNAVDALTIAGLDSNDFDTTLCLGGGVSGSCPFGAEYDSCPAGIDPERISGCWSTGEFRFLCGQ